MRNILVTGGMGFIGSNFVRHLLTAQPNMTIINLDALTYAGNVQNLKDQQNNPRHIFIKGNICDAELVNSLFQKYEIDTVVHFAAESHVDRSIHDPSVFITTNISGTFTLLEAAKKHWLSADKSKIGHRFHHISTDEVYGTLEANDAPFSENTPYAPNSPYAASKAASDHLVRSYSKTYGLPSTISNCSNNYGPYQFPEKLIPLVISNALQGLPLPLYGDGSQIRDWLHVEDHCEAVFKILSSGEDGETYNIGGGNQPTNLQLVENICRVLDELLPNSAWAPHGQLIKFVPDRLGHDYRYAIDSKKILSKLDWRPKYSLNEGLRATILWYLSNEDWAKQTKEKQGYKSWMEKNYKGNEIQ